MILSNYWKTLNIIADFNSTKLKSYGQVDINGNGVSRTWINSSYGNGNVKLRGGLSIRLGKGTGEILASDYALFDDCTGSISNMSVTEAISSADTDGGFSQLFTITGTNSSGSELTITEVGITKTLTVEINIEGQTTSQPIMFAKTLLENPLTVPAGGSFRLIIEWLEA